MTPQYAGLRTLHEDNKAKGFAVLGFPCNQFGKQEPGTNAEILKFAQSKYNVAFPMFEKIDVNGPGACELYQWLTSQKAGEDGKADIPWNFTKFLIDRSGNVVARFGPRTTPEEIAKVLPQYL
jgi:glutathione peroxidase